MPHLRGVTVHVTDSQGQNLQEWGIQYLKQHTETNRVSAYIQSTTDASFQISLQPEIPFPPTNTLRGENVSTKKQSRHRRVCSADRSTDEDHGEMSSSNTLSSPLRPTRKSQNDSGPDFAFLAVLYLDGRSKAERKIIVYTDPADKDFNSPDGKVAFKHRWVQSANGEMIEHAWVFKEKAIETVFDRLMIEGSQATVEDQDDDALIEAMQSAGIEAQGHTEKEGKVGQIVVELRRIVLGEKRIEANYRSHHQEGQDADIDMGVRPDITHATGFLRQNTLNPVPLRVVDYWPFKRGEVWATYQFFYRSREQLQKFHFPGFPPLPTTTAPRTTRLLNAQMAELTPLSISLPLGKKTMEVLPDRDSYEAKVKERSFKPDGSQKYDFGSEGYRLTPGDSYASDHEENVNDELATESDLETHGDDDDLDYSTNLEEEDEGYDSLQSQLKNKRIRKRQRDNVEDAEDHSEGWQAERFAHVDSDGKQKALNMPLTDEERTHQGKKLRTTSAADDRQGKKPRATKTASPADSRQDIGGDERTQGAGLARNLMS